MTGKVAIDSFGERMGVFDLHDLNPKKLEFEPVISSSIYNNTDIVLVYDEKRRPIYWEGLKSGKFPDSPKCGYNRAKCPVKGILFILLFAQHNLIFDFKLIFIE